MSSHQGQLNYISPLELDEGAAPSSTGAESFKSFIYSSYCVLACTCSLSFPNSLGIEIIIPFSRMRKLKLRVTLVGPVCWDSDPGPCTPRACQRAAVSQQRGAQDLEQKTSSLRAEQCQGDRVPGV